MSLSFVIAGQRPLLGQAILDTLAESELAVNTVICVVQNNGEASPELDEPTYSAPKTIALQNQFIGDVEWSDVSAVFVIGDHEFAEVVIGDALAGGASVIDCSGYSAAHEDVPLILSAINGHEIQHYSSNCVIASPSPAANLLAQIVYPLSNCYQCERINVTHFLCASSIGKPAVDQLAGQTARLLNGMPFSDDEQDQQQAFNLIAQSGDIDEDGYTKLESMLANEALRLLQNNNLVINASCVRVPVFYSQSQSIELQFAEPVDVTVARSVLAENAIFQIDDAYQASPAEIQKNSQDGLIMISRLRQNPRDECSLTLWAAADDVRLGAAANAVQIAEILIKSYL